MSQLVICLTLLNIGLISMNAKVYNIQVGKIEKIINEPLPCRVYAGEPSGDGCTDSNLNAILRHYKIKELN